MKKTKTKKKKKKKKLIPGKEISIKHIYAHTERGLRRREWKQKRGREEKSLAKKPLKQQQQEQKIPIFVFIVAFL